MTFSLKVLDFLLGRTCSSVSEISVGSLGKASIP